MATLYDKSRRISTAKSVFWLLAGLNLFLVMSGCEKKSDNAGIIADKPLADFQVKLLDVAFEAATLIPVKPHIKERSMAQEAVVTTCLKLDQPKRAVAFTGKIDNWRVGLCYADMAFYCAKHGYKGEAPRYIELAMQVAEEKGDSKEWQRDRIRAKIAQTYVLLEQAGHAEKFNKDLENSETGKVEVTKASVGDRNSFDAQIETLDSLIARGDIDVIKNALQAYAVLFDRFYDDAERRSMIEQKIRTTVKNRNMPVTIFLELLTDIAESSLRHNDPNKTIELVNETQLILDVNNWTPEDFLRFLPRLIELRFRAGDAEKARCDANAALVLFNEKEDSIVNIYRAGVLRPLAEVYKAMGDTQTALSVYKQAVEEGTVNPNSRPRAEDLSATCCSMALFAVEPDAELWARIHQIHEALGEPW